MKTDLVLRNGQNQINKCEVERRIKLAVKQAGSQKAFASETGNSKALVSLVINGGRQPSESMLQRVGVRKVTMYVDDSNNNN